MYAIHRFGSEEQKQRVAAADGRRARSSAASASPSPTTAPTRPACAPAPGATARDWVLDGRKMWITNGSVAGVAVVWAQTRTTGIRGFVVPTDTPGFSAPEIKHKWSLRASVTSELVLDDVRLPADAVLPEVTRAARAR